MGPVKKRRLSFKSKGGLALLISAGVTLVAAVAAFAVVLASLKGNGAVNKFNANVTQVSVTQAAAVDPAALLTFTAGTGWNGTLANAYTGASIDLTYRANNGGTAPLKTTGIIATAGPGLEVDYLSGMCDPLPAGVQGVISVRVKVVDATLLDATGWSVTANYGPSGDVCTAPAVGTKLA